jgi:prepilin-type N-terminal cleavage/methylation domain-containing protein
MHTKQAGVSLIELCVVLLLISILLTGTVSSSLKSQQLTLQAVQTLDVAYSIGNFASKIQLNKEHAIGKHSRYFIKMNAQTELATSCLSAQGCFGQLQALVDLSQLQQSLIQVFPDFFVSICRDNSPYDGSGNGSDGCDNQQSSPVIIKLWWIDAKNSDEERSFFYMLSPAI